jgi:hypothetical protein
MGGEGSELQREERMCRSMRSRRPGCVQQLGGTLCRSNVATAERDGAIIENKGRRRAGKWERNNSAPTRERSMAGTRMRNRLPIVAGGSCGWRRCWRRLRRGTSAARRFLHAGACGRAAFLQARLRYTGLCWWATGGHGSAPGRDGGRKHVQMCEASGEEGVAGRRSAIEMEP